MQIEKNLHFSSHQADILPKLRTHELANLVEYQFNKMKTVDLLSIALF